MKLRSAISALTLITLSTFIGVEPEPAAAGQESLQRKSCVLVELFTSEGCSSCPPADQVLMSLQNQQPLPGVHIITLGEHVSYWNYLGWQDPFSSDLFSERQHRYAGLFRNSSVYTPQMIIDGHTEFVGSDYRKALSVIGEAAKGPKAEIIVDVHSSANDKCVVKGEVKWNSVPEAQNAAVLAAVVEDDLHSSVIWGENSGRILHHNSVVREFIDVRDSVQPSGEFEITTSIKPSWNRQNLRVVVFAQNPTTGQILGAGETTSSCR
jgi:hypothetical protein